MKDYKAIKADLKKGVGQLKAANPSVMEAFGALVKANNTDAALSLKHKELIALGIAIAARCDGCIASHVQACVHAGATREEMAEAIGVAIMMGGGPSMVYGTEALTAFDQFVGEPVPA